MGKRYGTVPKLWSHASNGVAKLARSEASSGRVNTTIGILHVECLLRYGHPALESAKCRCRRRTQWAAWMRIEYIHGPV